MPELSPAEREFVDRIGLFMETVGGQRTMGRVYGWLMICDPPDQSLTELAETLGVSKASVSTVGRQLQSAAMIERFPTPNRQHRYRVARGGWAEMLRIQSAGLRMAMATLDAGLELVGPDRPEQQAWLRESRDFLEFADVDAKDLVRRWELHRENRGDR